MASIDKVPDVLAADVGNSSVRLALIRGEQTGEVRSLRVGELGSLGQLLTELWSQAEPPRKLAASSVNPAALKALEAAAAEAIGQDVLVVGRDLPLPIETDLPEPGSIGVDRLCCAAAAFDRLGVACVIADFGTAITIDCVNDEGVFLGGAILPGLSMSARGLRAETAQLPEVTLAPQQWVYGKNTAEAIVGGLISGARGALRELTESYATDLGHWPIVIATGGDAEMIFGTARTGELIQAIVPELALRGVAMAYYRSLLS